MKNKILKKLLSTALVATMTVSMLTACGNNDGESKESQSSEIQQTSEAQGTEVQSSEAQGTEAAADDGFEHDPNLNELGADQICKEPVTITIGIRQHARVEDYETNYYTKLLEETGNVNIDFVIFPSGDEGQQKLQMMIAAGEKLPDIIMWTQSDATAMTWGEEGYIIPLEDYFEHSSYYAAEGYAKLKEDIGLDVVEYVTSSDGHCWTFPAYQDTLSNPPYARMWIYQPWLDTLNLEVPTTTEELYDVLYAFKTQDPNGNGLQDELPIMGCKSGQGSFTWEALMNSFTHTTRSNSYLCSEDGQLYFAFTTDGWKEGVKYVAKLVKDGLFDPISFTQDTTAFQSIANGETPLVGMFANYDTGNIILDTDESNQWRLLEPIAGPDGFKSVAYKPDAPTAKAYITSDCENPEVAFRILDLMCREDITITSRWGKQGENWDYVENLNEEEIEAWASEQKGVAVEYDWENGSYAGYEPYFYEYKSIWAELQNAHWVNAGVVFRAGNITGGYNAALQRYDETYLSLPKNIYTQAQYLEDIKELLPDEIVSNIRFENLEESVEAAELKEELKEYAEEQYFAWITGNGDVEADWDAYLKQLEQIGLSRYLELAQKGWNP